MAEIEKKEIVRSGKVHPRGILVVGATVEELQIIQDIVGGDVTIAHDAFTCDTQEVVIRKQGVSREEMAYLIEGVMDVTVEGKEDLPVPKALRL